MVNGRVVVEDGKVFSVDYGASAARLARAASQPNTEKEKTFAQAIEELMRHTVRFYQGWNEGLKPEPHFDVNLRDA